MVHFLMVEQVVRRALTQQMPIGLAVRCMPLFYPVVVGLHLVFVVALRMANKTPPQ